MLTESLRRVTLLLVAVLVLAACGQQAEPEWQTFTPEEGEPSLLVILHPDASPQDISRIGLKRLATPTDKETGSFKALPGERAMIKISVHDHPAYLVAFRRDSSARQCEFARQRVVDDPAVLAVYENIEPSAITAEQLRAARDQSPNPSLQRTPP